MKRRNFIKLTATGSGGLLVLPQFLTAQNLWNTPGESHDQVLVVIQLKCGNDGFNTFIPYDNPLYYHHRPKLGIPKAQLINTINGMGFHPALRDLATIAQEGNLSVIQNVGYPNPNRSHFRSQEIWQTASDSHTYLDYGWLGRFLDLQCKDDALASLNLDGVDNLALKSKTPHGITLKDFNKINRYQTSETSLKLSDNPQLDFVRKIQFASMEGMEHIQAALKNAERFQEPYADNPLAKNLQWMSKLIKGGLASKIYYTSLNGFDTHNNQLNVHHKQLTILNDAVYSFYRDLKQNKLLDKVTLVLFSEFGRRVQENGNGTDHGTAGPMFVVGGATQGKVIGRNPDLSRLEKGDLIYETDFRSVYAGLLKHKFNFDPTTIHIHQAAISGLF
jgi:uncharacterized protein (DUF1501 family)